VLSGVIKYKRNLKKHGLIEESHMDTVGNLYKKKSRQYVEEKIKQYEERDSVKHTFAMEKYCELKDKIWEKQMQEN